jgi:hypothetical protein
VTARPTRRAVAVAALLTAAPVVLTAQVNVEQLRVTNAGLGVSGSAGAGFSARTGNVELVLLNFDARAEYDRAGWLTFLVGRAGLGWKSGARFADEGLLHWRFDGRVTRAVAGEVFVQTDYDKARLLTFRAVAGTGPRFTLAESARWRLAIGTAYMFEHEHLDLPPGAVHPVQTDVSRWSNYLSLRYGDGARVALVATGYAQPEFADLGDVRVLGDFRLAVKLSGALSLTVASNLRYDSRPPDGIRALDTATQTGVTVEW